MPVQTVSKPIDALATTTLETVRGSMADNIFKGNPVTAKLYDRREVQQGGLFAAEPVMYDFNTTTKWLAGGYDTLNTTAQEGMTWAKYDWRLLTLTTTISGTEKRINKGEAAQLSLINKKLQQTMESAREQIDREICIVSTAKDPNSLLGLDQIVNDTAAFTDTLGGIPSDANAWWRNQVQTDSISAWRIFLSRLYIACTEGVNHPDLAVTTKTGYANLEAAMAGTQRVISKEFDDLGFENILYKRMAIVPDFYIQAARFYMLNTKYLMLKILAGGDFEEGEFLDVASQDAVISKLIWHGQLLTNNRRFHGVNDGSGFNPDTVTTW